MKNKGFTLVEMLAVIGILGLLVILALPNVLKSYRDAKKVAFIDEAKTVYTKSTDTFTLAKIKGRKINYISNNEEDKGELLDIENEKNLTYTVSINNKGVVTEFVLTNHEFCIVGIGDFLNDYTKEQVIDLKDLGEGIDEELVSKCNGEIIHREGANLTLELKVNDDDKRHGAEHIPNELILRYGEGWYNKKTLTESITIPHRDNYYYVGSYYVEKKNELSDTEVISCNGSIEVDERGKAYSNGKNLYPNKQTTSIRAEAKLVKKFYIVTFKLGDKETGSINQLKCFYGDECTIPTNLDNRGYGLKIKKTGYLFKGWEYKNKLYEDGVTIPRITDDYDGEFNDLKFDNDIICKNGYSENSNQKSFEARWTPIKYIVKYNSNGGTGTMAPTIDTYDSNETFRENTFTRTGYEFLGWSLDKNKKTADYEDKSNIPNLASLEGAEVTVYAIWKARGYVVTFDMNGGEEGQSTSLNATYDADINISKPSKKYTVNINENDQDATLSATSVNGYQTFSGWSSNKNNGLGSNAKNGESDADAPWDGTATTKTHFKDLRDTEGSVKLTANWSSTDITLPTISKTGYTCGFVDNASDKNIKYASGGTYPTSNNGESVTIYARCVLIKITLADAINRDNTSIGNNVYNATGTTASEGGYYTATDVYGTSYYFRGNVNNNFVVFANKCWRVVRIDGNGNVRLILYNNNSSSCTEAGNSNAFVGNANYNLTASSVGTVKYYNSNLQQYINTWYSNAFTSAQKSKLAQTIWCADETEGVVESGTPAPSGSKYFKARNRIVPQNVTNPTMGCATTGHSRINSKVGFISSDEIIYAGGAEKGGTYFTEYHYYLLPNATSNAWWVLGSNKFDNVTNGAAAFAVLGNNQIARNGISTDMVTSKAGGLDCRRVSESLGVRPMIAIIPSAIITNSSQDGTASNPYIVKEN